MTNFENMIFQVLGNMYWVAFYVDFCALLAAPEGQCNLKGLEKTCVFSRGLARSFFRGAKKTDR